MDLRLVICALWLIAPAREAGAEPLSQAAAEFPAPLSTPLPFDVDDGPIASAADVLPVGLNLAELERLALRNNPSLFAARAGVRSAYGARVQAGLYPNPVIGYSAMEIGNFGTAGAQGGFIAQRFITAGKLRLDEDIAAKRQQEAAYRLDGQQRRVLSDVRVRYYDALVAQRRLALTRALARIGVELVDATQLLLDNRQVSENNLLQAEIEWESALILVDNAAGQHVEAWRRLAAVVGVPGLVLSPLEGELEQDLPDLGWEWCYATVLSSHPQLSEARTRIERARVTIERARRERIPNVELNVAVFHQNVSDYNMASVQAGIPIPILDANQGNITRAEADLVAARHEITRIELDLQQRLATTYRRYDNARRQAARYSERILPRAKRSLELVTGAYRNGQADYLTLLAAQQTFYRVELAYLDSLGQLREALSIIEGQLLTDSLSETIAP